MRRLIEIQETNGRVLADLRRLDYWLSQVETVSFKRLVTALCKLSLAAIPALVIGVLIYAVLILVLLVLVRSLLMQ